ncbi:MAG: ATP-binding cassette domain-containing protein [Anaerolineaceae bacterium]|nr:ATP-binding cassette domain-containing protein [Anaerolineaceae bacterium]MBN2676911.1 ATP-binding cassette domain-containing protein [Anaerolineaceae bacterium]
MAALIQVENLKRYFSVNKRQGWFRNLFTPKYELVKAVDDVCFNIEEGECIGYLGPNGSGKSTTIKCLTGILLPTDGRIKSLGFDPWKDRLSYVREIGVLFGQKSLLFPDLPVRDALNLYKRIYGISNTALNEKIEEVDAYLKLGSLLDKPVRKLSLGERMKCELLASLVHSPRLLFLDEPTIGLDILVRERVLALLKKYNSENKTTIFYSSHNLGEVENLCQKAILISHGKILFNGNLDELKMRYGSFHHVHLVYRDFKNKDVLPLLEKFIFSKDEEHRTIEFQVPGDKDIEKVVDHLVSGFEIADLTIMYPPIDEIVRTVLSQDTAG